MKGEFNFNYVDVTIIIIKGSNEIRIKEYNSNFNAQTMLIAIKDFVLLLFVLILSQPYKLVRQFKRIIIKN